MTENFHVVRRNNGHWDILTKKGRAFRIRGEPGSYVAMDEREMPYPVIPFKTVTGCMTFICEILMHENLILAKSDIVTVDRCGNVVLPNSVIDGNPPHAVSTAAAYCSPGDL